MIGTSLSFAAGIGVGSILPQHRLLLWFACVAVTIACLVLHRWKRGSLAGLLISVALLGALRYQSLPRISASLYKQADNLREITGTIVSYPEDRSDHTTFILSPDHVGAKVFVTLSWKGEDPPQLLYGDRVDVTGAGRAPENFADFDYRGYLARQRVFATMIVDSPKSIQRIGIAGSRIMRLGDKIRHRLLARIDALLPHKEAGLAHGLLLGEKGMMSAQIEDAFRRAGLMHLLAVSGLHLGIFLAGMWFMLRLFGLRPRVTYPVVAIAVLFILWIVGPRVSLVRAALLFAFLALGSILADCGVILRRWVSSYAGLAAAGLVLLAIRPSALWDVGFQLSFAATGAILFLFDPRFRVQQRMTNLAKRAPFPTPIVSYPLVLIGVSAVAQAGTAPFLAYHFHALYPLGLIASLIAIPLATLALWGGGMLLLVSWSPLAPWAAKGLQLVLHWLILSVRAISSIPGSLLAVPAWSGIWIGGIVVYLFMLAIYVRDSSSCTLYSTSIVPPVFEVSSDVPSVDGGRRRA
ncbi:ComEC family competence protein [Candidatus Bipolaricaulota bacterium]|nr:ComEC family competence protein [Candidatus Bipolaricaulota bacterium]